ncbi:hypothetical protein [Vibrio vulnificus]|uniref:hypothetical protein n=1 Tax=Vibrio vulnificus TaxID=672 RepID=UPI000F4D7FD1|nr:hypothetical protein CYV18_22115 [Vibrio vulnificus]
MVLESQKLSGCLVAYWVSVNLFFSQFRHWWVNSPNKQFNSDSQRLAILLWFGFCVYGAMF